MVLDVLVLCEMDNREEKLMKKLSDNEFVNMVGSAIDKLEKQGTFSRVDIGSGCMYQNSEGNCCIVGHMMPDSKTRGDADNEETVGSPIDELALAGFEWTKQFSDTQIDLLSRLQAIHDIRDDFSAALDEMKYVLCKYQMEYSETKSWLPN